MFHPIAHLVTRRAWAILAVWIAAAVAVHSLAPPWEAVSRDDDVRFFPPDYPSVLGLDLMERGFPDEASNSQAVVVLERRQGRLTPDDFSYLDRLIRHLRQVAAAEPALGIRQIIGYRTPVIGERLIGRADDGSGEAALTLVTLNSTYLARQTRLTVDRLQEVLEAFEPPPEGLSLAMTGSAAIGHDMNVSARTSLDNTTTATVLLVVVILLVVYRSPLLALIPLTTITLSVWVALRAIAMMSEVSWLNFQVINITQIFVIVVLFGAGTDYCLFLIARYREELSRGRRGPDALAEAIRKVGGALVASAGTVICGLSMLGFSTFAKIRYTGPAIALSLVIGLAAALTLAPVLLGWLRGAVFWPFRPPQHTFLTEEPADTPTDAEVSGFWGWVADRVVRHPGVILAASLAILTPLAVVGSRTQPNYSQMDDLSPNMPSLVGTRAVQRYFAAGEQSPTQVLLYHPRIAFSSDEGRRVIDTLTRALDPLPAIAEVRSITQPLGRSQALLGRMADSSRAPEPAPNLIGRLLQRGQQYVPPPLLQRLDETIRTQAEKRYVSLNAPDPADRDHITKLDIVFDVDPFSPEGLEALEAVRRTVDAMIASGGPLAEPGVQIGFSGATAMIEDLKQVTTIDERRMYLLVTLGVYAILLVLLRRPIICLYLIATVVLGYLAALGLTELVFHALHQGPRPWYGLDWKVGFFLFVILVAVGEDYNIFLMTRVLEEERKHGTIEGTRRAVAFTGGIISSCGVIMAGTFGSMLTGNLSALQQLGFALALGVLLDTFVVRPVLVPAFLVLWYRARTMWAARGAPAPASADRTPAPKASTSAS